jgi:hypothetical protein
MSKDCDSFSVVLLGSMNPRIHHPKWYQSVGIFSQPEVDDAIQNQPVICTPAFSQFVVGDLVIKCLTDRWDIQTANRQKIDAIREIAERLFDDLLFHTPVNVVALNFDYVREGLRDNATEFISGMLNGASAKLGILPASAGELILRRPLASGTQMDGIATIAIKTTGDPQTIAVNCNYNYVMRQLEGHFRLADFLPEYARRDRNDAESSLACVLNALNAD